MRDIAAPLPIIVIGDMLGVAPGDRDDLLRWSDDMLKGQGAPDPSLMDNAATAFVEYSEYIHPVFDDRRASGNTDDLVGVLCHAEIDGDSLDDDSLVHETLLILIGGDETTRHVISGGVEELLAHPDQAARLAADPAGLMPGAVEEMLRWVTPIKNMARTATRDVELAGARIRAGQELLLLYPSANRDEAVFDDPDAFDITRSPNPHMAFGFGAHFCLGNQLARLELRVMVERVLARLPDLHLAVDRASLPRRPANFISGIEQMPVEFTPSRARGRRPRLMPEHVAPARRASPAGPSWSPAAAAASAWPPPSAWPPTAPTSPSAGGPSRSSSTRRRCIAAVAAHGAGGALRRGRRHRRGPGRRRRGGDRARPRAASTPSSPAPAARCTWALSSTADMAAVRATIDLNLMGSVICVKQGAAAMEAQGGRGPIVLMSSGAGRFPHPHLWAYGISKAGICFLTATAAEELGPLGIRVNAVAPGIIDDELMSFITAGGPLLDDYLAQMPLGRLGTVEDVAAAVRFLSVPSRPSSPARPSASTAATTCAGAPTTRCSSARVP